MKTLPLAASIATLSLLGCLWRCHAERINHEGRLLGPEPVVTNAVLFNTAEADAILSAMQICPVTSAWNEDISRRPVLSNSDAMIAQIAADLLPTRRTLRAFQEMNFVLVPDSQPLVPITFTAYPEESDPGPWPIPPNLPIETWPTGTPGLTLLQWQQNVTQDGGDRHSIMVQPGTGRLWETWQAQLGESGWQASNGARFDLLTNAQRPAGWTSGDAAGLPMFPALPRFDECERGMVEHACRLIVKRTRRQYLYPANHYASTTPASQTNVPAMGQRFRLKASFEIPSSWSQAEKALLRGLKKYGAIVADNGNFFSISVTPDDRWPPDAFSHLASVGITNFEVIQTTGPAEGPRADGAPRADAGPDQAGSVAQPLTLRGYVSFTGTPPAVQWAAYSGPGAVTFTDPARTNTTARFSKPGTYVLRLSADNATHAVAYDAVRVVIGSPLTINATRAGGNLLLTWTGGKPPYVLERRDAFGEGRWTAVQTNLELSTQIPLGESAGFCRLRSE